MVLFAEQGFSDVVDIFTGEGKLWTWKRRNFKLHRRFSWNFKTREN
jgi:hypothetical protein